MQAGETKPRASEAGAEAGRRLVAGWSCAESVLGAVAQRQGVDSEWLPAIATGFCAGVSRRGGMCGAVSGAVMAISMVKGRRSVGDSREPTYAAVQALVDGFAREFRSINCLELVGFDLDTDEGQAEFRARGLVKRCRGFACRAAEMAAEIIDRASADEVRSSDTR